MTATVTAELWNATNSTFLSTLPYAFDHQWQETLNDAGSWSLKMPVDDTAGADATYGRCIRFLVDGQPAFTGTVETRERVTVAGDEEYGQVLTLSGRGLAARWEDAIVYPLGGVDARPASDVRPVNWCYSANPFYGSWPYVHVVHSDIVTKTSTNPLALTPGPPPKGWPAPVECSWIWSSNYGSVAPAGKSVFIYVYNAATAQNLQLWLTASHRATLYVDGIVVLETPDAPYEAWFEAYRTTVPLTAGYHAIGVEAEMYASPVSGNKKAMIAVSAHKLPTDGSPLSASTSVFKTDSTWQCLDRPTVVPGQTAGGLLQVLLLEAIDRGGLPSWTLSFDNAVDSAGEPWPAMSEELLQIGQDYLSVLRQLVDAGYIDFTVDAVGQTLNAYVPGATSTAVTTYTTGTNVTELAHTEKA